ncbi:plakophilin-3-like isoform X1 [Lates japonicus]|uniref:Plakophilin-3-like isoform X1 n=1 Tax=Lates japonicus TaxID=270547 RepID=A0AAD3R5U9_LATJO|nr:plakophilin-3-like isoform X1 [Lates japonicus]
MPSSEVVINICGALNHLVTRSCVAASISRDFNGPPKLVGIKTFHDNRCKDRSRAVEMIIGSECTLGQGPGWLRCCLDVPANHSTSPELGTRLRMDTGTMLAIHQVHPGFLVGE